MDIVAIALPQAPPTAAAVLDASTNAHRLTSSQLRSAYCGGTFQPSFTEVFRRSGVRIYYD